MKSCTHEHICNNVQKRHPHVTEYVPVNNDKELTDKDEEREEFETNINDIGFNVETVREKMCLRERHSF